MTTPVSTVARPLRVWPGVTAVVLLWLSRFGVKAVVPGFGGFMQGVLGGFFCILAVLLWWMFFSRARWSDRCGAIVLMIFGLSGTWLIRHESMGPLWLVAYAVPVLCLAFVGWAVASRWLPDERRRATMVATILVACGMWVLVRANGINGDHVMQFGWRWAASPEERLLAKAADEPLAPAAAPTPAATASSEPRVAAPAESEAESEATAPSSASAAADASRKKLVDRAADTTAALTPGPAATKESDWPGFRGPRRDGIVRGVRIETDWSRSQPVEIWRRPVGPGWSSFAVSGDVIYTQEQRGDEEVVASYNAATGQPVWTHRDAVRFFEANGGPGPRGTPAVSNGRVYTFGATGILNALDAGNGAVVWSRNVTFDTGGAVPYWGFASSPLVVDDIVIVAAEGRLVAYELATGKARWVGPQGGGGYSSPLLLTIDGVSQIVLMSGKGVTGVALSDGKLLWEHVWRGDTPVVQPVQIANGDLLIVANAESGTRRIAVARTPGGWTVEKRWTSIAFKPYFNDFVVHNGHAYGFDGRILACIDLEDGTRKWKGGRYGNGQLVLLPDQDLLLVLSEEGELALVRAAPDAFTELARFPAIEGKTWNHPVLAGGVLLVRNGQEMAAFRLSPP